MLGDYIDRGTDSKGVLDYIIGLRSEGFNIIALMGNHEDMMLRARNNPMDTLGWIVNGGGATMSSFEVNSVRDIDTCYFEFLESLPKYHIHDNYIFVHGGFNDEIDDPFSDEQSMLWDRRFDYRSPQLKDRIVVHGHRPQKLSDLQESLQHNPSVINLDTGCVYGESSGFGNLTALEIGKNRLFYA